MTEGVDGMTRPEDKGARWQPSRMELKGESTLAGRARALQKGGQRCADLMLGLYFRHMTDHLGLMLRITARTQGVCIIVSRDTQGVFNRLWSLSLSMFQV